MVAETFAAGQRASSNSSRRKPQQDFGGSSLHLEDSSGQGWLWSPRTGDAEKRRAASAETFRRRSPSWDLFAEGGPPDASLTPRGQRRANLACIARGEAPAPSLTPRTPRSTSASGITGGQSKPRQASQPPKSTQAKQGAAAALNVSEVRVHVGELSSTQRARACSVKGHHYKNKSLTSSGLWRDLPLYTPWGLLESTTQPSVSCANLTASRPPSAKRQGEVVAPYADGAPAPAAPVTPRQNSARDHYQKAMSARSVLVEGDAKVSDDRGRPRGTSSPSQQVQPAGGTLGSARARGPPGRGYPPVNAAAIDLQSKDALTSPRSPLADAGVPAGMHNRLDRVAIVKPMKIPLDGTNPEVEILLAATRRSDDYLHGIEESRVTPRHFNLPSRRAVSRQKISTDSKGTASCQTPQPKVKTTNGNMDLKLELAGLRRARAASSGVGARRKPQRWQV